MSNISAIDYGKGDADVSKWFCRTFYLFLLFSFWF